MTARQCFGNALSAEISEKLKIEREKTRAPLKNHLQVYHQIRDEMYDTADDETREKYEEEAKVSTRKLMVILSNQIYMSEIFVSMLYCVITLSRSQKDITANTGLALKKLCGWDWGGHGDTIFFVLGAYRDENSEIQTFRYVFSPLISLIV